jgi:drug/metabolite transporter superfamily protein YnfA
MTQSADDLALARMVRQVVVRAWLAAGLIVVACCWAMWLWLVEGQGLLAMVLLLLVVKTVCPLAPTREESDTVLACWERNG